MVDSFYKQSHVDCLERCKYNPNSQLPAQPDYCAEGESRLLDQIGRINTAIKTNNTRNAGIQLIALVGEGTRGVARGEGKLSLVVSILPRAAMATSSAVSLDEVSPQGASQFFGIKKASLGQQLLPLSSKMAANLYRLYMRNQNGGGIPPAALAAPAAAPPIAALPAGPIVAAPPPAAAPPAAPVVVVPPITLEEKYRIEFARFMDDNVQFMVEVSDYIPIPEEFEDDPILSQYICPITSCLIRHPITLKQSKGAREFHFERIGIFGYIQFSVQHRLPIINPSTRELMRPCQLYPNDELQAIIDERLAELMADEEGLTDVWDSGARRSQPSKLEREEKEE